MPRSARTRFVLISSLCVLLVTIGGILASRHRQRAEVAETPVQERVSSPAGPTGPATPVADVNPPPRVAKLPAAPPVPDPVELAPGFVPGHFPGVSVMERPGTHVATPPEGTPKTTPVEEEITLKDGRKLIGITLDESHRIPLKARAP